MAPFLQCLTSALICLIQLCISTSASLQSYGNNVCSKTCTEAYTQVVRTSSDCGFAGWSTCTAYRSGSFERSALCYECCPGWTTEEGSVHCDIASCFGLAPKGTCRNGGRCLRPDVCSCPTGTALPECQDIDECLTDNGGCDDTCQNNVGSFQCKCFTGRGLVDDKHCAPICFGQAPGKCQNGGTCVGIDKCECLVGTKAPTCEDVNECLGEHSCSHQCVNTLGTYTCTCNPGYGLLSNKKHCSPVCYGEEPGKCSFGNKCISPDKCDCKEGFSQPDCADIDECVDPVVNTCEQLCVNSPGSFRCECHAGYTFSLDTQSCQDLDECANSNGGCSDTCENDIGSYRCTCFPGYGVGKDQKTCEDVDECRVSNGGCYLSCINAIGSYRCECGHGYSWEAESASCKPVCFGEEPGVCQNGGTCSNPGICACPSGFQPPQCTDINECNTPAICQQQCNNLVGNYKCTCFPGYELQADQSCEDIDECKTGAAVCEKSCTNLDGSYECECEAQFGWQWETLSCKPVCFGESPGSCANGGQCLSPDNCVCEDGFEQPRCDDIDECAVNNGGCELACLNNVGSYSCECAAGYTWVTITETCAPVCNLMKAGTCPHAGVCIEPDVCQCAKGYGGKMCSDVDECSEGVASCNYYMCHNTRGSYYCDCDDGYAWNENRQACLADCSFDEPGVCPNGGECSNPGQCTCAAGFQLPGCTDIDECSGDHGCQSSCINTDGGYYCGSTTPGYGRLPGSDKDLAICFDLLPGECPNKGTCVKPDVCNCPIGYSAPRCDVTDDCIGNSAKCPESHTCASAGGKFYCKGQEGYGQSPGQKINKPICFGMYPGECPNGGECVNPDMCRCPEGYIPPRCEDTNECLVDNGGCEKECVNTKGSFYCSCWEGYGMNPAGDICEPICFHSQPGTCNGGGKCTAPDTCTCTDGYGGDECKDVNECVQENGGCELECHNSPGGYMCDCQTGFSWDQFRRLCRPVCNFGLPGVCPNDGICSAPNVCECKEGYQAELCQDIDECADGAGGCSSGCINVPGRYYCEGSQPGYGRLPGQEVEIPICHGALPGKCPSGGTCAAPDVCSCASGYDGPECKDVDECTSGAANCQRGCTNLIGSYYCQGAPGYGKAPGDTVFKPLCINNLPGLCANGGTCVSPGICTCAQGFLPPDCIEKENACAACHSTTCFNFVGPVGCRCTDNFEQVTEGMCANRRSCSCAIKTDCVSPTLCSCAPGYEGVDCTDIDECQTNNGDCATGCVNIPGSYYCQAERPGYGMLPGQNESKPVCFKTAPGFCPNGGECTEPDVCTCPKGYQVPDCSDEDECVSNTHMCQSGCKNVIGSYRCDCPEDYSWDDEDKTCKASCFGQPPGTCAHGGTCLRPWVCECKPGFATPDCSDIDECAVNNGNCDQTCWNTIGGYHCECLSDHGWHVTSGSCKPICMDNPAGECPNGGECISPDTCKCKEGYRRPDCTDIDECAADPDICEIECKNIKGSYYCTDGNGYGVVQGTGEKISLCYLLPPGICPNDGTCIEPEKCECKHGFMPPDCHDKNECIEDNGGCEEACHNTKGSFYCECRRGFGWSEKEMACKPVCFGLPPGLCPNGGDCLEVGVCTCREGFKKPDCSDIDECSTGDNVCEAGCHNNHGSYSCDCPEGYHWKAAEKKCLPICFGLIGTCLNNGICREPGVCECKEGFAQPRCTDVDECAVNNGGCERACTNLLGSYQCSCIKGYQYDDTTKTCRGICGNNHPGTCPNGGTCVAPEQCHCLPGFDPDTSCSDIDECKEADKCTSGACVNIMGSYYCECEQVGFGKGPTDTRCKPLCLSSSPGQCPNGGTCDSPGTCSCAEGYEGAECSDVNECLSANDCPGACINENGGYSCDCLFGYSWDEDKHECKALCKGSNSCQHGGECVSPNVCSCPFGYQDGTCEDVDECASGSISCDLGCVNIAGSYYCKSDKPGYGQGPEDKYMKPVCNGLKPGTCSHGGICFSPNTCSCPSGFQFIDSDCQDIDECAISNGGCAQYCENLVGSFKCDCELGYGWDDKLKKCVAVCDGLSPGECPDGGTCVGPGVCRCEKGFQEPDCSDIDECSTGEENICKNGCVNRHGFFYCQGSRQGYGRIPGEDTDKPICHESQLPGSCPNGGQCTAPDTCECNVGFELPYCSDINECETNTLDPDCVRCVNTDGAYHCECEAGYAWNAAKEACQASCYDSPAGECPNGGTCVEPFVCSCPEGYSEPICEDINECAEENGGCSQLCENKPGSFACKCNTGYSLMEDLSQCADTDECEMNNGDCPQKCVNMEGTYSCTCGEGYQLSKAGVGCEDVDECASSNGGCTEACVNTMGSFNCECGGERGVGPDGKSCAAICYHYDPGTCGPGGICINTDQCLCSEGYSMPYCTDIDECVDTDPGCSDKCKNTDGSFMCTCQEGYLLTEDHKTCTDIDECSLSERLCTHICVNVESSYICLCPKGYYLDDDGHTCLGEDACDTDNGGCTFRCENTQSGPQCVCFKGYQLAGHDNCIDEDECEMDTAGCSDRCQNTQGSWRCECEPGKRLTADGRTCERCSGDSELDCLPLCVERESKCLCPDGYYPHSDGVHCIGGCPCQNGGYCVTELPMYECDCSGTGYKGDLCTVPTVDIPSTVSVRYPGGSVKIHVTVRPKIAIIIKAHHGKDLVITTNPIVIKTPAIRGYFIVSTNASGIFRLEYGLAGVDENRFDRPSGTDVISGDVFQRHQLHNRVLPTGCFKLTFDHHVTKSVNGKRKGDRFQYKIEFLSTSSWYRLKNRTDVFFTFGVVHSTGLGRMELPLYDEGIELTVRPDILYFGPISPYRQTSQGEKTGELTRPTCQEIELLPEDRRLFKSAKSLFNSLFKSIKHLLPATLSLEIGEHKLEHMKTYLVQILTGYQIRNLPSCELARVIDGVLYYVFRFTHGIRLTVNGQTVDLDGTTLPSEFCLIVTSPTDVREAVHLIFPDEAKQKLEEIVTIKSIQEMTGSLIGWKGFSVSPYGHISREDTGARLWNGHGNVLQEFPAKSSLCLHLEVQKKAPVIQNMEWINFNAAVDVMFAESDLAQITIPLFIQANSMVVGFGDGLSVSLPARLLSASHHLKLHRHGVDGDGFASVGVEQRRSMCDEDSNPVGLFFKVKPVGHFLVKQPVFGDIEFMSYLSNFYFAFNRMNNFKTMGSYHFDEIYNEFKNLSNTLSLYIQSEVSESEMKSLPEVELIATKVGDMAVAITERQNENVSSLILDSVLDATIITHLADITRKIDDLDQKLSLSFMTFFTERLQHIREKLGELQLLAITLSESIALSITPHLQGPNSWGLKAVMSLHLAGKVLKLHGAFHYTGDVGSCLCERKSNSLSGSDPAVCINGTIVDVQTKSGVSEWHKRLWKYVEMETDNRLTAVLSKETDEFSVEVGVTFLALGVHPSSRLVVNKSDILLESNAKLFGMFPVHLSASLPALPRKPDDEWSLRVTGEFAQPGERSFSLEFDSALQKYASKLAMSAVQRVQDTADRIMYVEQSLHQAKLDLQNHGNELSKLKEDYRETVKALEAAKQAVVIATDFVGEELQELNSICMNTGCKSICVQGSALRICDIRDKHLKMPCVPYSNCAIRIPDFTCLLASLGCHEVRLLSYNRSKTALDRVASYEDTTWQSIQLTHTEDLLRQKLEHLKVKYNATNLVVETLEKKVYEMKTNLKYLRAEVGSRLYIHEVAVKYGYSAIFNVTNCGFQVDIVSETSEDVVVTCAINPLLSGWRRITIQVDFKNIVPHLWKISKKFITILLEVIQNGDLNDADTAARIGKGLTEDNLKISTDVTSWIGECQEIQRANSFVLDSVTILQNTTSYIQKNIMFQKYIHTFFTQLSVSKKESGIDLAILTEKYGIGNSKLSAFLAKINPLVNHHFVKIYYSAKDLVQTELEGVYYTLNMTLIEQWENRFMEDNVEFQGCFHLEDCVKWVTLPVNQLLDSVSHLSMDQTKRDLTNLTDLFQEIFLTTLTIENLSKKLNNVIGIVSRNPLENIFCEISVPSFARMDEISVMLGEPVQMSCLLEVETEVNIVWWKKGLITPIALASNYLNLTNAWYNNEGTYECSVSNALNVRVGPSQSVVLVSPPKISMATKIVRCIEGDAEQLVCQATGLPEPDYHWTTNAKSHPNLSGRFLKFRPVTADSRGMYVCHAENPHGSDTSHEIFLDVKVGQPICPHLTLWTSFIANEQTQDLHDAGDAGFRQNLLSTLTDLLEKQTSNLTKVEGFAVDEDLMDIKLSLRPYSCDTAPMCSSSECSAWYEDLRAVLEHHAEKLRPIMRDSLALFTSDKKYFFNSAYVAVLDTVALCPTGYKKHSEFVCVDEEKSSPIGPPTNLTYSVIEDKAALDWVPPQHAAGFVRGYNVTVIMKSNGVVYETLLTGTPYHYFTVDFPKRQILIQVRAYSRDHLGEWAYLSIGNPKSSAFTQSLTPVVGAVVGSALGVPLLLVVIYLVVLNVKVSKRVHKVSPTPMGSTVDLIGRQSVDNVSLSQSEGNMSLNVPDSADGTGDTVKPKGMSNKDCKKLLATRKIYTAS